MPRYQLPYGSQNITLTITSPSVSTAGNTVAVYGKNVNTGANIRLGVVEGDAANATLSIILDLSVSGLAVGDVLSVQTNDGEAVLVPNHKRPEPLIVELIEMLDA